MLLTLLVLIQQVGSDLQIIGVNTSIFLIIGVIEEFFAGSSSAACELANAVYLAAALLHAGGTGCIRCLLPH